MHGMLWEREWLTFTECIIWSTWSLRTSSAVDPLCGEFPMGTNVLIVRAHSEGVYSYVPSSDFFVTNLPIMFLPSSWPYGQTIWSTFSHSRHSRQPDVLLEILPIGKIFLYYCCSGSLMSRAAVLWLSTFRKYQNFVHTLCKTDLGFSSLVNWLLKKNKTKHSRSQRHWLREGRWCNKSLCQRSLSHLLMYLTCTFLTCVSLASYMPFSFYGRFILHMHN